MHKLLLATLVAALAASAAAQKPLREQSPAPQDLLASVGAGNSDAEIARVIAEASAHPLGTLANPVRVGGPEGERAYLERLRCADGSVPTIGERKPAGVGAYGSLVNAYPLRCAAGTRFDLVFDMYHEGHVETRAPAGFRIQPL